MSWSASDWIYSYAELEMPPEAPLSAESPLGRTREPGTN